MESTSTMLALSRAKDKILSIIQRSSLDLRDGQREALTKLCETIPRDRYAFILPTGYGKSILALIIFWLYRQAGLVNRLLIVVPGDTHRRQYLADLQEDAKSIGMTIKKPVFAESTVRVYRKHKENLNEVFVVTAQMLLGAKYGGVEELIATGSWMGIVDEYHKMREDREWGKAIIEVNNLEIEDNAEKLNLHPLIGMTATPVRTDRKATLFCKQEPLVHVSLEQAYQERAIRGVIAHMEHYFVDLKNDDDKVDRWTTESLRGESYWTKKELRFASKYYSSMLLSALETFRAKNRRNPGEHQMLVFCMTVKHAKDVSELFNLLIGESKFSDWVGEGLRDVKENRNIIDEFKAGKFQCLVQVDKASEGFNNPRCSVMAFLNILGRETVKARQQIGRGIRRNSAIRSFADDTCDVFVSVDTSMADLVKEYAMRTVGDIHKWTPKGPGGDGGLEQGKSWLPEDLPPWEELIDNVEFDREEIYAKIDEEEVVQIKQQLEIRSRQATNEEIREVIVILRKEEFMKQQKQLEAQSAEEMARSIAGAAGTLASTVLRKIGGVSFSKDKMGDMIRVIHRQWIRESGMGHDAMLESEFEQKYNWIRNLQLQVKQGEIPIWLQL